MRRQNLLIALAVLAVVAVAGLEIGAEVRAGRPGDHPGTVHGDPARFAVKGVTEDGIAASTAAQLRATNAGLAAAQRWLGQNTGAAIERDTEVLLTDHAHCARHADDPAAAGVTVDGKKICLFTADSPELDGGGASLRQAAAHEAVHVLQFQLGCGPSVPTWLLEGMAEDLSWRATLPGADQRSLEGLAGRRGAGAGGRLDYGEAMHTALELDDGHPARLVAFCRAVGDGAPWPAAFGETFDASPARFASRF